MIYDLKRSVDLRWLFDPVLHSSLDDLVSNKLLASPYITRSVFRLLNWLIWVFCSDHIKATVGKTVVSRRPLALGLHQKQMQFHFQEVDIGRHLQYAVNASQAFCLAGAKAVATTKNIFWKSFSVASLATKNQVERWKTVWYESADSGARGYLSDKLVHIILLSIASVGLDGKISSLPAADSGDVTNQIFHSVASCSADVGN